MSRPLPEDPAAFAAALLDPALPPPPQLARQAGAGPAARFGVYRNNVIVALIDALIARFPVTMQLVGEEFFRAMAGAFVRAHPPRNPSLMTYGEQFPGFVECFAPAASLPYLADVARVEVAWTSAWATADAPVVTVPDLQACAPEALLGCRAMVHPAVRLVRSAHPAGSLWAAHQGPGPVTPVAEWAAEDVLVTRPSTEVLVRRLAPGSHAFISSLLDGQSLESAFAAGFEAAEHFDPATNLQGLVEAGGLQALVPEHP